MSIHTLKSIQEVLQDLWHRYLEGSSTNSQPTVSESIHQVLHDLWSSYLTGSGNNSQAASSEEQSLFHLSMPNVYKQWAIGGIDAMLRKPAPKPYSWTEIEVNQAVKTPAIPPSMIKRAIPGASLQTALEQQAGPLTPTLLPHSFSPDAIKQYQEEYHDFLNKIGVLPADHGAVTRAGTEEDDNLLAAQEGSAPEIESYGTFRRRMLPELAPWQIEPTELLDYMTAPTAPARSTKDWFERVLPSSLVKAIGGVTGITAARTVGTRMGETSQELALGKMSPEQAALEDLKAIAGLVPAAAIGAVKGIPGLNGNWRQEWATDPVGTALGLLAVLGIGEGVREETPYLSRRTDAVDFLTKQGIPADQVDQTFNAIEKARAAGDTLDIGGNAPDEPGTIAHSTFETGNGQKNEEPEPSPVESTPKLYKLLSKNLEAHDGPRPFGHAAHHIVAVLAKGAKAARDILQNFDIPLSSADNGVWLPNMKNVGEGPYHPGLHTDAYYREVERRLKTATDREEALGILQDIKEELSKNKFPY